MKLISLTLMTLFLSFQINANEIEIILLKGQAKVIRGEKSLAFDKKTTLIKNDVIQTGKRSFVRLKLSQSLVTIAPNSYYKISGLNPKNENQSEIGTLIYGHLHAIFEKNPKSKRIIKTTSSALGIRGTKILLHVTRDEKEYRERYKGKVHSIPDMSEVKKLLEDNSTFTQICCIKGLIEVQTNGGQSRELSEGQVMNFSSIGKQSKFKNRTRKILLKSSKAFGFDF